MTKFTVIYRTHKHLPWSRFTKHEYPNQIEAWDLRDQVMRDHPDWQFAILEL